MNEIAVENWLSSQSCLPSAVAWIDIDGNQVVVYSLSTGEQIASEKVDMGKTQQLREMEKAASMAAYNGYKLLCGSSNCSHIHSLITHFSGR